MALLTTTIGAYPKPDYVPTPDWFREGGTGLSNPTEAYQKYLANLPNNIEEILDRGTKSSMTRSMLVSTFPQMARFGEKITFITIAVTSMALTFQI